MSARVEIIPDEGPPSARGPRRRCVVTRESGPGARMLRFVVAPDNRLLPDLEARLPGRGLWLNARKDVLDKALDKRLFARAARAPVEAAPDLAATVERLLARRCLDLLGLARRAGQAVNGYDRVRAALEAGGAAVLLAAVDGAEDGRRKLAGLGRDLPRIEAFTAEELGAALGRGHAVHAAVGPGRLADRLIAEVRRLAGFRAGALREASAERR